MTKESIKLLNKEYFPLFKIVIEESYRIRDNKSSLYVKDEYGDPWKKIYSLPSSINAAHFMVENIKNNYGYWKSVYIKNPPVMFVYHNQVFSNPHVMFDQLCIAGNPIEPDKYYIEDGRIKVDFYQSYVQPVPKDEVLVHAGQLYLNGKLILSKEKAIEYKLDKHIYYGISDELKKAILIMYPEAKTYRSGFEWGYIKVNNDPSESETDKEDSRENV